MPTIPGSLHNFNSRGAMRKISIESANMRIGSVIGISGNMFYL
ncbi:hypothetical protein Mpsy_2642 [Methanolobus psychrophilus R15]|nr:hypothetical protein Mpsy_2642 [Methanolobus psychrophilus R15]